MEQKALTCGLCHAPVVVNRDRYEVFEGMHWLCFHIVYEHGPYDPDEQCEDPSCPWAHPNNGEPSARGDRPGRGVHTPG